MGACDLFVFAVAAQAEQVHGNVSSLFVRAVCRWRRSSPFAAAQDGRALPYVDSGICAEVEALEAAARRGLRERRRLPRVAAAAPDIN
eukprot:6209309-Pleurochrysis_carterae.AAC.1